MAQAFDLVIRGGLVVDGSGAEPYRADVAVNGGVIAAVGQVDGSGVEEIDAAGCIVTPGFIDVHTHYDGQAIWSDRLDPSSLHGVTTAVMGNCGVGFAPCRSEDRETLIRVMEGVEDIPGAVMAEGLSWDWETFPEFLDAVDQRPRDIDVAAYLPHSPLRVFVMGERGVNREAASQADLSSMTALVKEAIAAGALGCATSRVVLHRTADGDFIPTYGADESELQTMANAMGEVGAGILQLVGNVPEDGWEKDLRMMRRISEKSGRPVTFTGGAGADARLRAEEVAEANRHGGEVTAQVFPRPVGLLMAHNLTWNPFSFCASFAELAALPPADKLAALGRREVREQLLHETPNISVPLAARTRDFGMIFPLQDPPNYEPAAEDSVAGRAAAAGVSPLEWAYDYLLTKDGQAQLLVALGNFPGHTLDAVGELLVHPNMIPGLGDGGAHYGLICDASFPTFMLAHWTRDRDHGRLSIADAVAALTHRSAQAVRLLDRGLLAVGYKADINVIDHDRVRLLSPTVVYDLPGGGRRLMQKAEGYRVTIVSGRVTYRDGEPTGLLPGKLVRGGQTAPAVLQ